MDNATIECLAPNLGKTSLAPLEYLLFENAPPTTQARIPVTVLSDPSNFTLEGSQEVTSGTETLIRIVVRPNS